jgi:hypothetical protein
MSIRRGHCHCGAVEFEVDFKPETQHHDVKVDALKCRLPPVTCRSRLPFKISIRLWNHSWRNRCL